MGTLGTNKNFKIGDEVEILPLTRHEKDEYPVGWDWNMDTYIGSTGTIEHITPNGYKIKGCGRYSWCDTNLRSTVLYEPY